MSGEVKDPSWSALYAAHFGRQLTVETVEAYETIILQKTPGMSRRQRHDAIRAAMRRLADMSDRWAFRWPTAGEIAGEMDRITTQAGRQAEPCAVCGGLGIIDRCYHIPGIGAGLWTCPCREPDNEASRRVVGMLKAAGQERQDERYLANSIFLAEQMAMATETKNAQQGTQPPRQRVLVVGGECGHGLDHKTPYMGDGMGDDGQGGEVAGFSEANAEALRPGEAGTQKPLVGGRNMA